MKGKAHTSLMPRAKFLCHQPRRPVACSLSSYLGPSSRWPRPHRSREASPLLGAGSVGPVPITVFMLVHTGSGSGLQCRCSSCRKKRFERDRPSWAGRRMLALGGLSEPESQRLQEQHKARLQHPCSHQEAPVGTAHPSKNWDIQPGLKREATGANVLHSIVQG